MEERGGVALSNEGLHAKRFALFAEIALFQRRAYVRLVIRLH